MEQQKAVKPAALEALVETLKADYKHLMVAWNSPWCADDREPARLALAKSVRDAQHAIQSVEETSDVELRHWHDQLVIQSVLAEGGVKNPHTLKR
jgi:hypothetical protein